MGVSQNFPVEASLDKAYSMLGSFLGDPCFGKLPHFYILTLEGPTRHLSAEESLHPQRSKSLNPKP